MRKDYRTQAVLFFRYSCLPEALSHARWAARYPVAYRVGDFPRPSASRAVDSGGPRARQGCEWCLSRCTCPHSGEHTRTFVRTLTRALVVSLSLCPLQLAMGAPLDLKPQPPVPGNGCPCQCCGGAPAPIDVQQIVAAGGKFVQASDGRIIEYYVYGSERPDALVLLQVNGSNGTGRLYSRLKGFVDRLVSENVKGISISLPGHGLSSNAPDRRIGDWPRDDVETVFAQEGVQGQFMVEGTSFGSSHCLAVMHHFSDRVTHAHLHVPYVSRQVRTGEGMQPYGVEELMFGHNPEKEAEHYKTAVSCDPRILFVFCACSLMMNRTCLKMSETPAPEAYARERNALIGYDAHEAQVEDILHCSSHSVHGLLYNALSGTIVGNWGFDPRDTAVDKMKILVSYGELDTSSPGENGKFLAEWFTKKAEKCVVNVGKLPQKEKGGGHDSHIIAHLKGDLLAQMLAM